MAKPTTPDAGAVDVQVLTFAEAKKPLYAEKLGEGMGYVTIRTEGAGRFYGIGNDFAGDSRKAFGAENGYFHYLLWLFNSSPKHGAVIQGKVTYITGQGWVAKTGTPDSIAQNFIDKPNDDDTLNELTVKIATDLEIFKGCFVEVIWNLAGNGFTSVKHIDYLKVLTNKDRTQFWYKDSWLDKNSKPIPVAGFNPATANPKPRQILYITEYQPGIKAYPLPGYMAALNYIEADVEVSKHVLGNAQTGFTASTAVTMVGNAPEPEKKKRITEGFERRFTGTSGKKVIVSFVQNKENAPVFQDLGASDLTKEDFTAVSDLIRTEIYAGHRITTPALFGIPSAGALSGKNELREGYEIFNATYVSAKQTFIEGILNKLLKIAGSTTPIAIRPIPPVGIDFTSIALLQVLPKSYVFETLGIDATKYPDGPALVQKGTQDTAAGGAAQMETQPATATAVPAVNSTLTNLTGRQFQGLMRVSKQYDSGRGKLTRAAAIHLLTTGYGISEADAAKYLDAPETDKAATATFTPLQMADALDADLEVFASFGIPKGDCLTLRSRKIDFTEVADAATDEADYGQLALAFEAADLSKLQVNVLDLISKDKHITPEVLAATLKTSKAKITAALTALVKAGAITQSVGDNDEPVRELTKPLSELTDIGPKTSGLLVRYSYEGPEDSRNRPFCARILELGRLYSRSDIEQMSERLGYSVFDRRGGWYTLPGTDEHRPYCRHYWASNIVVRTENGTTNE